MEIIYVLRGLLKPILKPVVRLIVGLIAIPLFRIFMRKVVRLQTLDAELEKDLEEWFRGSLLLLIATANMEHIFFDWVPLHLQENYAWLTVAFRIMLAISVVETMPDQELFSIIHPGPPKIHAKGVRDYLRQAKQKWREILKGVVCQHINRSSPVFAIMAAIFGGVDHSHLSVQMQEVITMIHELGTIGEHVPNGAELVDQTNGMIETLQKPGGYSIPEYEGMIVGWVCYFLAIIQYLIIGLVTSKDKALDVLSEFDRKVAERRREIIDEFSVPEDEAAKIESAARKEAAAGKETSSEKSDKPKEEPEES